MHRIVDTRYGKVRGLSGNDPRVTVFRGIPYALPPVGKLRWRAPVKAKPWEGILNAYEFAPISIQDMPGMGDDLYCREFHVTNKVSMDEDCLYLNIWKDDSDPNPRKPVMIWIFGGGFQWGYTSEMEFDGERLAKRGIVVVSVNYRLGALGFLAHPDLTHSQKDDPCNFGILDQKAGIRWVYENIASFGGDPENITIAGQSAGAASVMAQMEDRDNEGIVKAAAVLSGMIRDPFDSNSYIIPPSLNKMEENGIAFLDMLGVKSIEEARKLDALYIRDKYAEFRGNHPFFSFCIDGIHYNRDPYDSYCNNKGLNIPVLSGNTRDEFYLMTEDDKYSKISAVEFSVKNAFLLRGEIPSADKNMFYYSFEPDIPGEDNPGCFHSCELWFFFETLQRCTSRAYKGRHFELARSMCSYLANFVKFHNPNGYDNFGEELPTWESYSALNENMMHFTSEGCILNNNDSEAMKELLLMYKEKYKCID